MIKKVIILVLIIIIPKIIYSQTYIGLKGGLTFGWYSDDNWQAYKNYNQNSLGLSITDSVIPIKNLGVFIDTQFYDNIGLSCNVSLNTYGQDCIIGNLDFQRIELRQYVVEMPVMLKLSTSKNSKGGIYCILGPIVQYLFRDYEIKYTSSGKNIANGLFPQENLFALGIFGGGGYEYPGRNGVFKTELGYGRNISKPSTKIDYPYEIINCIEVNFYYGSRL